MPTCPRLAHFKPWTLGFLFLFWSVPALAEEIPATLRPNWPQLGSFPKDIPVWVAASKAFDDQGRLIPAYFREISRLRLERLLRHPKDPATGCTKMLWIDPAYVDPPNRSSLASAVRSSEMVVWGKVMATEIGFERGQLGQMLAVQPLEILKGKGVAADRFYVFVPAGRFRFGGYDVCKEDPRFVIPKVGDEMVLLPYLAPAGENYLNLEYEGSLIVFGDEGRVEWPRVMAKSNAHNAETPVEVLGEIRRIAAEEKP